MTKGKASQGCMLACPAPMPATPTPPVAPAANEQSYCTRPRPPVLETRIPDCQK